MPRTLVTAPSGDVVTTAEAKAFAKIDHSSEDTLIASLVDTAEDLVARHIARELLSATYDFHFDSWPGSDVLPIELAPVSSVTSVSYVDTAGTTQVLATSVYTVDLSTEPARIYLAYNQTWPTARAMRKAITVRAVVGYANAAAVPEGIKTAIKAAVAYWLDNRGCAPDGLPDIAKNIANRYRYRYF